MCSKPYPPLPPQIEYPGSSQRHVEDGKLQRLAKEVRWPFQKDAHLRIIAYSLKERIIRQVRPQEWHTPSGEEVQYTMAQDTYADGQRKMGFLGITEGAKKYVQNYPAEYHKEQTVRERPMDMDTQRPVNQKVGIGKYGAK